MWGYWFLASLLATSAHGFAPARIRWGGLVARRFVVAPAPSASTDKAFVSPLKLTVWDSSGKVSPDAVPHFSANRDDTITWDATGWCLEASGTKRGDAVQVSDCTGGPAQRWKWLPWGPIQLKGTNQCLDVIGAGSDLDGASIELQTCENKASESWMFEDEASPSSPSQQHGILFNFVASMAMAMTLGLSAWLWRRQQGLRPTIVSQHSLQRSMDWKGINLSETFATRQVRTPWHASDNASTHERVHAVMAQSPEPADDGAAEDLYSQCMAMKASEIKAELDLRKISWRGLGLLEKEEIAKLLAESRRTGKVDPEPVTSPVVATPSFDAFLEHSVGKWRGVMYTWWPTATDETRLPLGVVPGHITPPAESSCEVSVLMRSCGGAVQGVTEERKPNTLNLNRQSNGFTYFSAGSWAEAPVRLDETTGSQHGGLGLNVNLAHGDKSRRRLLLALVKI